MSLSTEKQNEAWALAGRWHYSQRGDGRAGYKIERSTEDFIFYTLTPSGAYWLAANLNKAK